MRKLSKEILKEWFNNQLIQARAEKNFTQLQMSELLLMDERSYIDLEHGKTGCSALTLVLFIIYFVKDKNEFFDTLKNELKKINEDVA